MEDDLLVGHVPSASEDVLLVNPSRTVLEATIELSPVLEDAPTLRVLAREELYKTVVDEFLLAWELADLVDRDRLQLRASEDVGLNTVLVTDDAIVVRIAAGSVVEHIGENDASFVSGVAAAYEDSWQEATPFEVQIPARSRIQESLLANEALGEPVWEDFAAMVELADAVDGDLDEVGIAVLAAAKHGRQLYHLSKWGEGIDLASKATFSRMKSDLEDRGVVETIRVPVDVGRPRQRLTLPESLADADAETLVEAAAE